MTDQEYKEMIHNIVLPTTLSPEERVKRYQPFKDYLKTATPKKLYRFRSCKERTIDEFDQNKLGFSPAYIMNDDFDGLLYFDKEHIRNTLVDTLTPQKVGSLFEIISQGDIPAEIKDNIPPNIIKYCIDTFSQYTPVMTNTLINQFLDFATNDYDSRMYFLSQVTQSQKVVCLSPDVNSPAMWGYYAEDGKGFALSYDVREPDSAYYCPAPVIYDDERLDATEYATWLFQQQIMKSILIGANAPDLYKSLQQLIPCPDDFMSTKVLMHKSIKWSHEKEWRLVYYERNNLAQAEFPYIIKQPTGIYLGRNISTINEKILRHIAVERNIPVYKMTIREDDSTYNLYPKPI